jgi:hypothetical protein
VVVVDLAGLAGAVDFGVAAAGLGGFGVTLGCTVAAGCSSSDSEEEEEEDDEEEEEEDDVLAGEGGVFGGGMDGATGAVGVVETATGSVSSSNVFRRPVP